MTDHAAIRFIPTSLSQLPQVVAEEKQRSPRFISAQSLFEHQQTLSDAKMRHWMIVGDDKAKPIGHLILNDMEAEIPELRRLVIYEPGRGFGRLAIRLLKSTLAKRDRFRGLWLDVHHDNATARSLYLSEGFQETHSTKQLIFMRWNHPGGGHV